MKRATLKSVLFFSLVLTGSLAFAGVETAGDGGAAVVCQDSVRTLDLYEAEQRYGVPGRFLESGGTLQQGLETAMRRFSEIAPPQQVAIVEPLVHWVLQRRLADPMIPVDYLFRTHDNTPVLPLPDGCYLMQLAMFHKDRIQFNEALWIFLSPDDRVAILLHETFHFFFPHGETTELRELVGYLAAPSTFRAKHHAKMTELVKKNTPWRL